MKLLAFVATCICSYFSLQAQDYNVEIDFSNESGCIPLTTEFSLIGADENVVWTISNGQSYSGNYQRIQFEEPGVYSVSATFLLNGKEETITEERLIEAYPKPHPQFDFKTGENSLETIPTIGSLYAWYLEDGTLISDETYQLHLTDMNPGEYVIILEETNSLGCTERTTPKSFAVMASN